MMEGASATPLPLTAVAVAEKAPTTNTDTGSLESSLAASVVRRVLTFTPTNPLPGVTSLKSFGQALKKEAPKVLDLRGYSKPTSAEQAVSRIRANVSFFRVTYTAAFATIVLLFILSNPTLFIFTVLLAALWAGFLSQPPEHVMKVGSVELKRQEKLLILGSGTILVVVFGGLISSALYILFMSGFVVGAHGALREPVELDALEQLEAEGESIVKGDMV